MKITKEQLAKGQRKVRRDENLDGGFKTVHTVHPSKKTYNRKKKYKDIV